MTRLNFVLGAMLALLLTACQSLPQPGAPPADSVSQRAAVYRAFLAFYSDGEGATNVGRISRPLRFQPRETAACAPGIAFENLDLLRESTHDLSHELRDVAGVRIVDAEEQRARIERSDPMRGMQSGQSVDEAVDDAFAAGLLTLSEVAFDSEERHAVLSFSFVCGGLCGHGALVLYERGDDNVWRPSDRQCGGGWIS